MKMFMFWYLLILSMVIVLFIVEGFVDKMSTESTFRKWWRKNVVGEAPKDLDF